MGSYVLAHDLGTTGNKATLYNEKGRLVASAFEAYPTEYLHERWAEQDPKHWWRAVCDSTHELLEKASVAGTDVACVTFSGQMMGCVPLDQNAHPLRNAIIWADQRATEEAQAIRTSVSFEDVYQITGHRLSASYSLAKILWLRNHDPECYDSAYKFTHAKDAMVARMTGIFATDPSDASGMNLYNLQTGTWSYRILSAAQLDPDRLPEVHPSNSVVGRVSKEVAESVGLPAGTPVVIGGGDGACAAAGAGVVAAGLAYNYVGSSSWIALATQEPIWDPDFRTFTFAHIVPNTYMPTGTMQAAGASYQWTRDQLCRSEAQAADALQVSAYELMDLEIQDSPPGANGLLYLPYLLGERSPHWNPKARGAFIGLTIRHSRADMIRAVLEGVTMNLRIILDAFRVQGAEIEAMRVIGGGARSRVWNQIMADIYGMPVHRLAVLAEATSMGAALAGGTAVGLYPDFNAGLAMNPVVEVVEPNAEAQTAYDELYEIFCESYEALVPVYDRLDTLH